MNRLLLALAVVGLAFFLVAPAAVAQEVTADDYIELFKPIVGTWKTLLTVDGKTVEGWGRFRLSRTNKCFVAYGEGGGSPAIQRIEGYDPATKQWKTATFDADGGYSVAVITVKDMKKGKRLDTNYSTAYEEVRYSKDGKKTVISNNLKITAYDKDRIEGVLTESKEEGQPRPDTKFIMERQPDQRQRPQATPAPKADSQDITAADYIEYFKPLVGSWKIVFEAAGTKTEGTRRVRLSPNNKCLLTYAESERQPSLQVIEGYDPGTKKWTGVVFDSDGGMGVTALEVADMKKGKRLEKGVVGKIEINNSTKDGKTTTIRGTLACTEFAENRIVFTGSDEKQADQQVPSVTMTWERQPDTGRRARQ